LIGGAFIPVVFSMNLWGCGRDDEGREFVLRHPAPGRSDLYPPDLFVVDPEGELLGRLPFDASADETIGFLKDILRRRPDLAPPEGPNAFDLPPPELPGEVALADLQRRYDEGDKAVLVGELEAWLDEYADELPESAALARVLLGGARYHADDFAGADAAWESVIRLHPENPLRHRAYYNRIEQGSFPSIPHDDVMNHPIPSIARRGIVVPDPAVRERNLTLVESDPRYLLVSADLPFVRVPAGTFTMGGTPAVQVRELPVRRVTLTRPFLMSAWPVTRRLWSRFRPEDVPEDERGGLAAELPMVGISWTDAEGFCRFLSQRDGRQYRLPTEAEWEYAARGGLEGKMYPWGDETATPDRCNYLNRRPVPVACYPANGYGLFDMVGNNFEWTADFYLKDTYARTPAEVTDPTGPDEAQAEELSPDKARTRVVRGGGWMSNEMSKINCRNSWRLGWPEVFHHGNIGVRVVADAE
jgi:formylglycine-generating enzyme required for sulfatase activity